MYWAQAKKLQQGGESFIAVTRMGPHRGTKFITELSNMSAHHLSLYVSLIPHYLTNKVGVLVMVE